MIVLVTGPDGRWAPGLGDDSCLGYFTVLAYAAAAYFSFRATKRAKAEPALLLFWSALALALVALGINKQLDLQTLFTEIARDSAKESGWYEDRRHYQMLFINAAIALGFVLAAAFFVVYRRHLRKLALAIAGLAVLATFVVVRAASFHHVDTMLGAGGLGLNALLELGGLTMILVAARRFARPSKRPKTTSPTRPHGRSAKVGVRGQEQRPRR